MSIFELNGLKFSSWVLESGLKQVFRLSAAIFLKDYWSTSSVLKGEYISLAMRLHVLLFFSKSALGEFLFERFELAWLNPAAVSLKQRRYFEVFFRFLDLASVCVVQFVLKSFLTVFKIFLVHLIFLLCSLEFEDWHIHLRHRPPDCVNFYQHFFFEPDTS